MIFKFVSILELLYPNRCKLCSCELLKGQNILCSDCFESGNYYLYEDFNINFVDEADSPLVYTDFVRKAMHEYKFRGKKIYADWFATFAQRCILSKVDKWNIDFITYVPMSFFSNFRRGYNQAELVAKIIAREIDLPVLKTLEKRAFVKRQSLISDSDKRLKNVENAFKPFNPHNIAYKRILIIDDVITTGATISMCAKTLRECGASAVFAVGMTKTPIKRQKI